MRIEQLTFTRFIAAVAVVIFHFGREVFPFQFGDLLQSEWQTPSLFSKVTHQYYNNIVK